LQTKQIHAFEETGQHHYGFYIAVSFLAFCSPRDC
jgi:hypothetical protein